MNSSIRVRVPATSANLGPGFDCLGMALDLWNEVNFTAQKNGFHYEVSGEGAESLNGQTGSLLERSFYRLFETLGEKPPTGVLVRATNAIPLASGLGSSAAAVVAGLAGANAWLGNPLNPAGLLNLAVAIEGHPDNAAPALLGGLVAAARLEEEILTRRCEIPPLTAVVVRPEVELLTHAARAVLPRSVLHTDAVFNLSRVALVVEALREGDLTLLAQVMDDKLHQPYRLAHIPGGGAAYLAARQFGAAALSGAGPSLIVFLDKAKAEACQTAIQAAFSEVGIGSRSWVTHPSPLGAQINV